MTEASHLSRETLVQLDGNKPITWGEFLDVNDNVDDEIHTALLKDGEFRGGGGAAAEFLITVVTNKLTAAMVCDDLDDACKLIQDALGIKTGDVAAQVFMTLDNWESLDIGDRRNWLSQYLHAETLYAIPSWWEGLR